MHVAGFITNLKQIALLIGLAGVSACGGGAQSVLSSDIDDSPMDPNPSTPPSTTQVAVTAVALSSSTRSIFVDTGTFDTATNALAIGAIRGGVNAAGDRVTLVGGGTATLTSDIESGAARFESSPFIGTNTTGIVGYPTLLAEMPGSGTASYLGDTRITAQIGSDLYELTGRARLVANFDAGTSSALTLNNLSGQRFPALGAAQNVSDVANLSVANISISGAGLTGGSSTATGGTIILSGNQSEILSGQFFGSNAAEAGGLFVINDTNSTGTIITGDFLVK